MKEKRKKWKSVRKAEDLHMALNEIIQMTEEDDKIGRLFLINSLLTFNSLRYRVSAQMKEEFVETPRKRSKLDREEMARVMEGKALTWIKRVRIRPRRNDRK